MSLSYCLSPVSLAVLTIAPDPLFQDHTRLKKQQQKKRFVPVCDKCRLQTCRLALWLAKLATWVSQTSTPVSQTSTSVRLVRLAISDGNGNMTYNLPVCKSAVCICRTPVLSQLLLCFCTSALDFLFNNSSGYKYSCGTSCKVINTQIIR